MTFQGDPKTIRWRLYPRSSPESVYMMLTTDDGRAAFWAESAVEETGFTHLRFINGVECRSRILESRPPRCFGLTTSTARWSSNWSPMGREVTDLTVENSGFPEEDRAEILAGC